MSGTSITVGTSSTDGAMDYDHMCKIVTTDPKMLALLYAPRIFSGSELDSLASSLIKTSTVLHTTATMVEHLLHVEFEKVAATNTKVILRANTLTTKVMDQYIQNYTLDFLNDVLGDVIRAVVDDPELDLEVDSSKISASTEEEIQEISKRNAKKLEEHAIAFVEAIISDESQQKMPVILKCISHNIRTLAESYEWEVQPLIGSFIMLRLFNPTVVFPEKRRIFGDSDTTPSTRARRNLILISKLLQNLGNNVRFGQKEEFMICMNAFIDSYQSRYNEFLEKCSTADEALEKYRDSCELESNLALMNSRVSEEVREEALNIHFLILSKEEAITKYIETNFDNASEVVQDFKSFIKRLPEVQDISRRVRKADASSSSSSSSPENPSSSEVKYRALLDKALNTSTDDLDTLHIIKFCGRDKQGLPIVIFNEENIRRKDLDRVLLYIVKKMDQFVNNDYTLVWCVNSSGQNRPGLAWMFNVYRTLSRKYKKNLKAFYMVHPVWFYKYVMKFFRPLVSEKFWKKLHLIDSIYEIYKDIDPDQIAFSPNVLSHDFMSSKGFKGLSPPVFQTPLEEVMNREDNKGKEIPVVLDRCISYVEKHGLEEHGIFRISGNSVQIQKLKILFDRGDNNVDLDQVPIHTVTGVLKLWLREMPEPLLTFDLYKDFIDVFHMHRRGKDDDEDGDDIDTMENSVSNIADIEPLTRLMVKIPEVNFNICKRLFRMMHRVSQYSDCNQMHAGNLAIVLAPNILRPKNETPIQALQDSSATQYVVRVLISEYAKIFEQASLPSHRALASRRNARSFALKRSSIEAMHYETQFHAKLREIQLGQKRVEEQQRATELLSSQPAGDSGSNSGRRSRPSATISAADIAALQSLINQADQQNM